MVILALTGIVIVPPVPTTVISLPIFKIPCASTKNFPFLVYASVPSGRLTENIPTSFIATSRSLPVVCSWPIVKLLPGVVSIAKARLSAPFPVNGSPSPFTGTARNALTTSRKPGVSALARLFEVTAS